jgi:hypothetical protein
MRRITFGALALMLALAGCGSDDGGDQVASAADPTGGPGASASPTISLDEMQVKFAQCLRDNGLDVPDPEPGKGMMLRFGPGTDQGAVEKAMEACREYNPQANGAAPANPQQEENGRKYAQCMRENGVEAFPDPEPGQRGLRITGEVGNDPDFQAAQEKCQDILSGGGR